MDAISLTLLLCHAAATLFMVGLIWFVQRVHYPLLSGVGSREFATYEQAHVGRTFPVVGPPMVLEAATAAALVASPDTHVVAFTGGVETGRRVAVACAERMKPCVIEAGGSDPMIISEHAPLDVAVAGSVTSAGFRSWLTINSAMSPTTLEDGVTLTISPNISFASA